MIINIPTKEGFQDNQTLTPFFASIIEQVASTHKHCLISGEHSLCALIARKIIEQQNPSMLKVHYFPSIENMPLLAQQDLAKNLHNRRVIATSNIDLQFALKTEQLDEGLWEVLAGVTINIISPLKSHAFTHTVMVNNAEKMDLKKRMQEIEDAYIQQALQETNGNVAAASVRLGLRRTTLIEKIKKRIKKA